MSRSSAQAARSGSTWRSAKSAIRTSPSASSALSAARSVTRALGIQSLAEVAAAERDIAVVAAHFDLCALAHGGPVLVDAQVHRRLAAAMAYRLELDQRIG